MARAAKGKAPRHGRVVRWISYNGLRRGLLGGSPFWLTVGGLVGAFRLFRRLTGTGPEVVFQEELTPGQSLVISHGAEPR
jgi:hypothetical protein